MPGFSKQGAVDASFGQDIMNLLAAQFKSTALTGATLTAGLMTGAAQVFLLATAANGTSLTTRTASQIYADLQLATGLQNLNGWVYFLRVTNTSAGTTTLVGGTGVTITGPATLATNTFRDYVVTVTDANTIGLQSVGLGTAP